MADEVKPKRVKTGETDLVAMNAIARAMAALVGADREAVIEWFHRKYPLAGQGTATGG
jgi:hypothetical protein